MNARLRHKIDDEYPDAEFNIEGYPSEDFLLLCEEAQHEQVTLVPDDPSQATSDHGWDFRKHSTFLKETVARLTAGGMRVSLFADGDGDKDDVFAVSDHGSIGLIDTHVAQIGAPYFWF